jgi:hypothetical protein
MICPRVLTEYELGLARRAIEEVSKKNRALTEVCTQTCDLQLLQADLSDCVAEYGPGKVVHVWTKTHGGRHRYGFYSHPWVKKAFDLVDAMDPDDPNRHWMQGLLFGYSPESIQEFFDKQVNPRG